MAQRYLRAVSTTLARLADMPDLGRLARFSTPVLRDLRFYLVERPFEKHLIFYRHDEGTLYVERAIHGAKRPATTTDTAPGGKRPVIPEGRHAVQ